MMTLCEQCGNEFYWGKPVEKEDGKKYIQCPYCGYNNRRVFKKKKKRSTK